MRNIHSGDAPSGSEPRRPLSDEERTRLIEEGTRLLASGKYFRAHEAFEDLWNGSRSHRERETWQGLTQIAAALVKHERRETTTAISLLAKARSRLLGLKFEGDGGAGLHEYLDRLADPLTNDRDLPSTELPVSLLEALRAL